jgi:alpha-1,3-rhamnosyl/mannosyltransferase
MRVLVNGLASVGARTGIGHYAGELVRCLRARRGGDEVAVYPPPWLAAAGRWWRRPFSRGPAAPRQAPRFAWRAGVKAALHAAAARLIDRHFRAAARAGYDLYHEPNVLPLPCELPTVVTVHDLSVLLHPEWHPADRVARHQKQFAAGIARSRHVLTVSDFARREIIETLGLPPDRVSRTYNGVRPHLRPMGPAEVEPVRRALNLPPRYLLFVGTLEPRKNVLTLLRSYLALPAWVRARYPLVLAGGVGWNADAITAAVAAGRSGGVVHAGYVADEHLPALYNGARALVFPSFYEGFGLPPVEMLACGGAVLASTAGAVAEVVGDRAHLIDPADGDGWREALLRVATDDDWWQELRRGAADAARPFTWERCAEETWDAYARALGGTTATRQPRAA